MFFYFYTMKVFIPAAVLVTLAFIALGIRIFFIKGGKFPETEVGRNREMRKLGLTCAKCEEKHHWNRMKRNKKPGVQSSKLKIDISQMP